MKKSLLSLLAFLFITFSVISQTTEQPNQKKSNKGRMYCFWGWNRAWYSNSDIHFTGKGYDFTIKKAGAKDRPTPFSIDPYFHPSRITIPQTNVRIGYFINDKYDISLGYDHMKYVMVQHQTAKVYGTINIGNNYDGIYTNEDVKMEYDFLTFEHTDGLNYIDVELTRNDDLFSALKIAHNHEKIQLNSIVGFGAGLVYPKSNVMLLYQTRHDAFHIAGYGISAKAGLNLTFYKHFFARFETKYGFINMPDIRTTPSTDDKASQHFFFTQINWSFGYTFFPFN